MAVEQAGNPPSPTERSLGVDPQTGHPIVATHGPDGPYVERIADEPGRGRRMALPPGITAEGVTLEEALAFLALPRQLGRDPILRRDIVVWPGADGPYLKFGSITRKLDDPRQILTITFLDALQLLAAR